MVQVMLAPQVKQEVVVMKPVSEGRRGHLQCKTESDVHGRAVFLKHPPWISRRSTGQGRWTVAPTFMQGLRFYPEMITVTNEVQGIE